MKPYALILVVAGLSCVSLAQSQPTTSDNNAAAPAVAQPATQPATPPVMYGGTITNQKTQVVPITGETRIHGSTVPASMMPQRQESLGDAARRLRKKKYRKYHKNARKAHRAKQQPPYLR